MIIRLTKFLFLTDWNHVIEITGVIKSLGAGNTGVIATRLEKFNPLWKEGENWNIPSEKAKIKQVSVGNTTAWGVHPENQKPYMSSDYGKTWQNMAKHGDFIIAKVAVSGINDDVVWVLSETDTENTYRLKGETWETIAGTNQLITCGQPGVWGVYKQDIYYRAGTRGSRNV